MWTYVSFSWVNKISVFIWHSGESKTLGTAKRRYQIASEEMSLKSEEICIKQLKKKKREKKLQRKIGRLQQTGHPHGRYIWAIYIYIKVEHHYIYIYKGAQPHLCVCMWGECQLKSRGDLGVMEIMPIKNGQKMWRDVSLLGRYVDSKQAAL